MQIAQIKKNILDILFPRFCLGCGKEGAHICENCEIFLSEVCPKPGLRQAWLRTNETIETISVWEYEGLMEKAILKIKYGGRYDIIDELVEKALETIELNLPKDTIITFVPMWRKKERQRGFNQAAFIARKLGQLLHLVKQPLLEKVRDNKSQVRLGPKERAENVRGAFCTKPGLSQAWLSTNTKSVLLVDDVYTTGATMGECVRVLKKAGVKNVYGFTIARKLSL